MKRSHTQWWGIALIVVGALLLLGNMSGMDIGELIRTWWPVLLVAWGLNMLLRHGSHGGGQIPTASAAGPGSVTVDQLAQSSTFGDLAVRVSSQAFRGGTLSTVFGDTEVDLQACVLADGDHWLKINGVFGDTSVVLPHTIPVSVTATTTFGDVDVVGQRKEGFSSSMNYESPEFQTATKKLHIQASQVFGDVEIRR
jgi:lia operon protein LiaF